MLDEASLKTSLTIQIRIKLLLSEVASSNSDDSISWSGFLFDKLGFVFNFTVFCGFAFILFKSSNGSNIDINWYTKTIDSREVAEAQVSEWIHVGIFIILIYSTWFLFNYFVAEEFSLFNGYMQESVLVKKILIILQEELPKDDLKNSLEIINHVIDNLNL